MVSKRNFLLEGSEMDKAYCYSNQKRVANLPNGSSLGLRERTKRGTRNLSKSFILFPSM